MPPKKKNTFKNKPKVVAPVATSRRVVTRPAKLNGKTNFTVTHRELLYTNMKASAGLFASGLKSFLIQPGVDTTFPWLSSIASRYEYYRFTNLCFHYTPRCPSTTAGTVCMAVELDVADPAPNSDIALASYAGAVRGSPWTELDLRVSVDQLRRKSQDLLTRHLGVDVGYDARLYDFGRFYISLSGPQTGSVDTVFGDLSVSYTVSFSVPQLQTSVESLVLAGPKKRPSVSAEMLKEAAPVFSELAAALEAVVNKTATVKEVADTVSGSLQLATKVIQNVPVSTCYKTVLDAPGYPFSAIRFAHDWRGRVHIQGIYRFKKVNSGSSMFFLFNDLDDGSATAHGWPQIFPLSTANSTCTVLAKTHTETSSSIGSFTLGSFQSTYTYRYLASSMVAAGSYLVVRVDIMLDVDALQDQVLVTEYQLAGIDTGNGTGMNSDWEAVYNTADTRLLDLSTITFSPIGDGSPELASETGNET